MIGRFDSAPIRGRWRIKRAHRLRKQEEAQKIATFSNAQHSYHHFYHYLVTIHYYLKPLYLHNRFWQHWAKQGGLEGETTVELSDVDIDELGLKKKHRLAF